jgi:hypothetical protein
LLFFLIIYDLGKMQNGRRWTMFRKVNMGEEGSWQLKKTTRVANPRNAVDSTTMDWYCSPTYNVPRDKTRASDLTIGMILHPLCDRLTPTSISRDNTSNPRRITMSAAMAWYVQCPLGFAHGQRDEKIGVQKNPYYWRIKLINWLCHLDICNLCEGQADRRYRSLSQTYSCIIELCYSRIPSDEKKTTRSRQRVAPSWFLNIILYGPIVLEDSIGQFFSQ